MSDKIRPEKPGEGDRESDRKYREDTERFVKEGKVEQAAEEARDMTEEEKRESHLAEEKGRSRAREEDPEIEHKSKGHPPD